MEMQQIGRELSESFKNVSAGSLNGQNTEAFAKMGIAKSLSSYYAGDKGEVGTMFSAAIDRLYERGIAQVQRGQVWSQPVIGAANTSSSQSAVKAGLDIADTFSISRHQNALIMLFVRSIVSYAAIPAAQSILCF